MPSQPPIPPILNSHLSIPPPDSLTLVSSTLTASANWLTLRFLYSLLLPLRSPATQKEGNIPADGEANLSVKGRIDNVILVSWLHPSTFFTDGLKKLVLHSILLFPLFLFL